MQTAAQEPAIAPVRVMVVDDSAVIRGLLARTLESDPEIAVVSSCGNGQMAVSAIARTDIDVVVLDIEMPVMDGLTALPKLLAAAPGIKIIMASTLTQRNAQISLDALAAGASDYLAKPTSSQISAAADFKRELVEKVKALGRARVRALPPGQKRGVITTARPVASLQPRVTPIVLRAPSKKPPMAIAIGSSTGGPQALFTVFSALPTTVRQPIFITQHMPPTFTTILAQHLSRSARRPAAEGIDGETVKPGQIYLAPGDFHMQIETRGADKVIRLIKGPPENFCRPAVDPMLRSLSLAYGGNVLCAILTGMGADGARGSEVVAAAGGTVIAQDEASSVVWGMPGATAASGSCSAVLPVTSIAAHLAQLASGNTP